MRACVTSSDDAQTSDMRARYGLTPQWWRPPGGLRGWRATLRFSTGASVPKVATNRPAG